MNIWNLENQNHHHAQNQIIIFYIISNEHKLQILHMKYNFFLMTILSFQMKLSIFIQTKWIFYF